MCVCVERKANEVKKEESRGGGVERCGEGDKWELRGVEEMEVRELDQERERERNIKGTISGQRRGKRSRKRGMKGRNKIKPKEGKGKKGVIGSVTIS